MKINTVNVRGKAKNFARRGNAHAAASRATGRRRSSLSKPGQKIELGGVNYFEQ